MTNFHDYEKRFSDILKRAGIPTKKVTITRVTIIVELFGEKYTERVASYLRGAGWVGVKIFDNRPSIFQASNTPNWRVSGMSQSLYDELHKAL